ncbi:RagB/SusD family nutrient uptake outer membrane protein [Pontibacter diazotrophicus]|uniref:RagB/SusD family nutrient uptake outer membrane protein n=1 Tax=Pontibacter diazotrophicus TaxID=1400979 RepID=A0A3D8LB82_9BACT|nr:RagB/SusD family nutrient uptake outer membrane protein [Pontibacter diazotrophicus]RDV14701.1 RagB/SusD family nutrient uptake outer membrane protein [Pontibacter diazotrophicus]
MNQIYKNKALGLARLGLLGVLLMGAPACEDTLDEEVISRIGNDYMNTAKGMNDAVNAAYSSMRTWYGTERGNNFTIFGTDTYTNGADGGWKFMNTYTTQFDTQNGHVRELWDELYRGINTTNAIIERAPAVTGMDEEVKKQRIAEAKFIRAHHYFILTQLFGGVDLRLTETMVPTKDVSRSTVEAQYEAIIRDLTEAIPDLEAAARSSQYGRATRPAAEHLLGKVYLTKATSEAAAADDYANAIPLFQNVINNYGLRLLPDFADVHRQGNEMNDEVIWSVQYTRDPLTNGGGNNTHVFFLMEYDVLPGMQRDTENGRPFKRYMPTEYTLNEIFTDREIDSRYKKSFKDTYYSNKPGTYNTSFDTTKPSVTFAEGDTAIYMPGYEMSAAEMAKRPYQVLVPSRYDERLFPALTKHMDAGRVDRTQFEGGRDYIAFRLADTYLMLAEAQLQAGQTAEAVENINMVRRRAAWPGQESAMEITADQLDMEFIIEERERELIGEQMRWLDLKRWGILIERVKAHNEAAAPNIQAHHVLRPIPQTQVDRSATAFAQNPGY